MVSGHEPSFTITIYHSPFTLFHAPPAAVEVSRGWRRSPFRRRAALQSAFTHRDDGAPVVCSRAASPVNLRLARPVLEVKESGARVEASLKTVCSNDLRFRLTAFFHRKIYEKQFFNLLSRRSCACSASRSRGRGRRRPTRRAQAQATPAQPPPRARSSRGPTSRYGAHRARPALVA